MTEVIQYTIGMSNGFLIRQGETVLAVDGGGEMNGDAFLKVCEENGIEWRALFPAKPPAPLRRPAPPLPTTMN